MKVKKVMIYYIFITHFKNRNFQSFQNRKTFQIFAILLKILNNHPRILIIILNIRDVKSKLKKV